MESQRRTKAPYSLDGLRRALEHHQRAGRIRSFSQRSSREKGSAWVVDVPDQPAPQEFTNQQVYAFAVGLAAGSKGMDRVVVALDALVECLHDNATAFNCREADWIASLYVAVGKVAVASSFIEAHAVGDVEGDEHFTPREAPPGRLVIEATEERVGLLERLHIRSLEAPFRPILGLLAVEQDPALAEPEQIVVHGPHPHDLGDDYAPNWLPCCEMLISAADPGIVTCASDLVNCQGDPLLRELLSSMRKPVSDSFSASSIWPMLLRDPEPLPDPPIGVRLLALMLPGLQWWEHDGSLFFTRGYWLGLEQHGLIVTEASVDGWPGEIVGS